ncbi:MAG: type II secretion system protein GspD [Nitrospinae bacterium RIFCSPLOWO2_02_FULL_39_110]|nr:MAG: type II secretion system protein GspD [Nitrospinae bacterium RIFCSPHIGHO2_02_39_11]OGV98392.1 MAG: type II secretion system protein GspD [Nitrospinae bacterium RIFCSPHIGHO2_12_FULL_39_42]OGW02601.1 MAG: type II secretion system protein GspD [Nitrospinae bacterium RIFCSPHIGHO2_02_FULL_39_82]OGW06065.1 MAG: type II secretion system protein GspD [Nitrospinae bacterium RIFCSPLOWO2_02_FULL_39_110]OGW06283.1 MAG: type II secretion system protein GspD [Nitrospinae bacterium RIFCSPLOWO2_02_39_1
MKIQTILLSFISACCIIFLLLIAPGELYAQNNPPLRKANPPQKNIESEGKPSHSKTEDKFDTLDKKSVKKIVLNFDNADIYEIISIFSDFLGINYIIDPRVRGTVNIHTKGEILPDDLFDIFTTILKSSGAAIVKEGDLYHIIPATEAKTMLLTPRVDQEIPAPGDEIIFQIVQLMYVQAKEFINIIRPFTTQGALLTPYERGNTILLIDFASNVKKVLDIVNIMDVSIFSGVEMRLFRMKEANVEDIVKEMEKLFASLNVSTKSATSVGINFISITRLNSLLVITSIPDIMEEVERWIEVLDKREDREEIRTYIYHVKNGIASDLTDILNEIFGRRERVSKKADEIRKKLKGEPAAEKETKKEPAPAGERNIKEERIAATEKQPQSLGITDKEVEFIPYSVTNTVIIKSTLKDYKLVREVLDELDVIPRQVVIEVLIAEITLTDDTRFGIEYAMRNTDLGKGIYGTVVGTSLGLSQAGTLAPGGLTASVIKDDFSATFNALAKEDRLNILASPHILARDGKEASINIGDEVPIITGRTFVDNRQEMALERRNTGVILKVTPHINTTGLVTIELNLELSNAQTAATGQSDIKIFQRKANNSMVVQDGQTVLIGGLINEQAAEVINKVPFLGDIFLIKHLFRYKVKTKTKTELVLLLTPRVLKTTQEARDFTIEFSEKVKSLKDKIREHIKDQ